MPRRCDLSDTLESSMPYAVERQLRKVMTMIDAACERAEGSLRKKMAVKLTKEPQAKFIHPSTEIALAYWNEHPSSTVREASRATGVSQCALRNARASLGLAKARDRKSPMADTIRKIFAECPHANVGAISRTTGASIRYINQIRREFQGREED